MQPVIAIVGRPNVGKSTLFNCLTRTKSALVADFAGLTRDRQYGDGVVGGRPYMLIDTGGLEETPEGIETGMRNQAERAMMEADYLLFLVDARAGITPVDQYIAQNLRRLNKPITLVVNKIDGTNTDVVLGDFYALGLGAPQGIAASHGRGVEALMETVLSQIPEETSEDEIPDENEGIHIAVVGRPNVGKSTLVNRILGEERVVVFDEPGTTRDSIFIPFERHDKKYVLIDTAGVRKRGRIDLAVEKFSVIKTLQAVSAAHVVVFVFDAQEGIVEQDLHLLGYVLEAGRAVVLAINKWDGLTEDMKDEVKREMDRRLEFVTFVRTHFISALHGSGVGNLFTSVHEAYAAATQKFSTPKLTKLLHAAIEAYQPPLVHGRRVKLRYAHAGGNNPPIIVIHGNQVESLPESYQRYLNRYFREAMNIMGTPIQMSFKNSLNPFAGRHNTLTERQIQKRKRLRSFSKKGR